MTKSPMRLSRTILLALLLLILLLLRPHVVVARAAFLPILSGLREHGEGSLYAALSPSLMDSIIDHPSMSKLLRELRPRSRLKEHHAQLFLDNDNSSEINSDNATLFIELALVACRTGVVCRKEFLETYAAATYIHAKFRSNTTRMADLAAGHGLLSWFLLALDEFEDNDSTCFDKHDNKSDVNATASSNATKRRQRTVVCIDRRMPSSANAIATVMMERFPTLRSRWSYIQSDLSSVVPHPSCLLTSVHACGTLSDYIIHMAMDTSAPLAIVPCCHTVKERMGYQPHALSGMNCKQVVSLVEERKIASDASTSNNSKHDAVADVVDEVRCRTLRNGGYHVEEVLLPEAFTARNRVILGTPPGADKQYSKEQASTKVVPLTMPPLLRTSSIPLSDDPESIAQCHAMSGRSHTAKVSQQAPPRHFSMHVSLWLEDNDDSSDNHFSVVAIEMLQTLATEICGEHEKEGIQCTVEPFGKVNIHATTGRLSRVYRLQYRTKQEGGITGASRIAAKRIHGTIRKRIFDNFGGNVLR